MTRPPAPTLLLLAGAATRGLGLLTELARALGHQVAPAGAAASRLGGWFGTGDRVAVAEPDLADRMTDYVATADRLGAALPVIVLVEHPCAAADTVQATAWMDAVLGAARAVRGRPHAVLPLGDLLDDWQAALTRCDKESGSRLLAAATLAQLDDADDLVAGWGPARESGWSEAVDPALRDLAARAHAALTSLAEGRGDVEFVDALWSEYAAEWGAAS